MTQAEKTELYNLKFIRAEYRPNSHGANMMYFWECNICGKEYATCSLNIVGLCDDCLKNRQKEQIAERKEKAMQAGYKSAVAKIKKHFDLSAIPSVKVDGEIYCQRKALLKALNDILNESEGKIE